MFFHGRHDEHRLIIVELDIFECKRSVDRKGIFIEPIGIEFRRRTECALDPLPDELTVEQDAAADKANPYFVRGGIAIDAFHPEFELGRRPLSRIGREHLIVRHGRIRPRLRRERLSEQREQSRARLRRSKEGLDFVGTIHKRKEDVIRYRGERSACRLSRSWYRKRAARRARGGRRRLRAAGLLGERYNLIGGQAWFRRSGAPIQDAVSVRGTS